METLNYILEDGNLKVYQDEKMFKFSIDSLLLANFVSISSKKSKILDIGTGNAVIPILLTMKTKALIDCVEIQKDVYNLGVKSIEYNKLNDQISIYHQDIKEYYKNLNSDVYDTITCNPPYFKITEIPRYNISEYKKIARHEIMLNLEDIMKIAKKLLKNNGNISIVHRTNRMIDIIDAMKKNNIEPKKIQFVYSKKDDISNIILIEGVKNGNPGLKILSPLYIHDESGKYNLNIFDSLKTS